MTYSITNREAENHGSLEAVYATVDITSLDSAGYEPFDPEAALGVSGVGRFGVSVRALENPQYRVAWDSANGRLDVINVSDGADVTSGTDVGEVLLEVTGT